MQAKNSPRPFLETLFDWESEPSNRATSSLFQPKGLGTVLSSGSRRQAAVRRLTTLMIAFIACGAGVVAVMAFARYFRIGMF